MIEERVLGNAGRLAVKARLFKPTVYLVCAALFLASCSTYKARLDPRSEPRAGAVILPSPTEDWKLVEGEEKITGWVKLRFEVSATGEVRGVQTIETSDERLSQKAAAIMASWAFEPGTIEGEPAAFEDIEFMMTFTEETADKDAGLAIVLVMVLVVALAVALALDAKRNCGGAFSPC